MSHTCLHGHCGGDLAPLKPFLLAKLPGEVLTVGGGHQEDVIASGPANWTQAINRRLLTLSPVLGKYALPTVPIAGAIPKIWH